jgi:hypothetical protein
VRTQGDRNVLVWIPCHFHLLGQLVFSGLERNLLQNLHVHTYFQVFKCPVCDRKFLTTLPVSCPQVSRVGRADDTDTLANTTGDGGSCLGDEVFPCTADRCAAVSFVCSISYQILSQVKHSVVRNLKLFSLGINSRRISNHCPQQGCKSESR